jgi:hypothetical protein
VAVEFDEELCLKKISWTWQLIFVNLATQEAKIWRVLVWASMGKKFMT